MRAVMSASHTHDRDPARQEDGPVPAPAVWVKPVLVEYGHLAKLTRGSSGLVTEAGGMKMCL